MYAFEHIELIHKGSAMWSVICMNSRNYKLYRHWLSEGIFLKVAVLPVPRANKFRTICFTSTASLHMLRHAP